MGYSLGQKQEEFTITMAEFIVWAYSQGYKIRSGDTFRDPRVFGAVGEKKGYGHARSAHKLKLARDLNLFKDGAFLSSTEDHAELGKKWESMHELARWGGRFNDGNHYSFEHNGVM